MFQIVSGLSFFAMVAAPVVQSLQFIQPHLESSRGFWDRFLTTFGYSADLAQRHIEVNSRGDQYVIVERGQEWSQLTTRSLDKPLYQIFEGITTELASSYELQHRLETQGSRRIRFQRQVGLLVELSVQWAKRQASKHDDILRQAPFDDWVGVHASLIGELCRAGYLYEKAVCLANQWYPNPNEG